MLQSDLPFQTVAMVTGLKGTLKFFSTHLSLMSHSNATLNYIMSKFMNLNVIHVILVHISALLIHPPSTHSLSRQRFSAAFDWPVIHPRTFLTSFWVPLTDVAVLWSLFKSFFSVKCHTGFLPFCGFVVEHFASLNTPDATHKLISKPFMG